MSDTPTPDRTAPGRPLDEVFDTHIECALNPYGAWQAIQALTAKLEAARNGEARLSLLLNERAQDAVREQARAVAAEAERDAVRDENLRLRDAGKRALREAVADDMDGWFANLRAALDKDRAS